MCHVSESARTKKVHDSQREKKNLLERVFSKKKRIKISKNSFFIAILFRIFLTLTSLTQACNAGTQYTCTLHSMTTHTVIAQNFSTMNKYFMKYIEKKLVKLN
jgi:hypothetical protein